MRVAEPAPTNENDLTPLLLRFELPLLQYAARILRDRGRARDAVQDTFLEWQRSPRRQSDPAPAKWLFTVCRNRALNICRKENAGLISTRRFSKNKPAKNPRLTSGSNGRKRRGFLLRIVATLPPHQQEVLQLKFKTTSANRRYHEAVALPRRRPHPHRP